MGHRIQIEIERKYDVDESVAIPDVVGVGAIAVAEEPQDAELVAVYYDTETLELSRGRTALRRREGGADAGWHVKVAPLGAEGRTEHHWPLTDDGVVPPEVRDEVRELVGDRPLVPVARVANRRSTIRLLDAAGYPVAEVCDDHVSAEDLRRSAGSNWREWEVELLAAAPDDPAGRERLLDGVQEMLLAAGARISPSSSKLARALGLEPSA